MEVTRNLQQISADHITYDQAREFATLSNDVEYWDDAMYLKSESGEVDYLNETSSFRNAFYFILDRRARGRAENIFHDNSSQITRLKRVTFTTCEPEDNFWKLSSSSVKLDHEEESYNFV